LTWKNLWNSLGNGKEEVRWAWYVACMGQMRNIYKTLVRKHEEKSSLERSRCKWEDNIRMDLREIEWEGVDWVCLVQDMDQWWALVNKVMNEPLIK
jgi:hypothetical protein